MNDAATFREHVDTIFRVDHNSDIVPLRLVEVTGERIGGGLRQFSLMFHGPAAHLLPQNTYSFHHDALGEFLLFIVPVVGSNLERIVYEACFSLRMP